MSLPDVAGAQARILSGLRPLEVESVPLAEAHGRALAQTVEARRDQPPFDASAMDGWAVRRADALEATAALRIVGESAAGRGLDREIGPGEAARIFTGAPVPAGADCIVLQEVARREREVVHVGPLAGAVSNIRSRGGDFSMGAALLTPGVRLDAWRLSLAAAAGLARLEVVRKPRVAILSTGDEIVPAGEPLGPWQIWNSGGPALAALCESWGATAVVLPPAGDTQAAIAAAVSGLEADLLVTVGGASVGDHDLVKPALARLGLDLALDGVAMRPGKPSWFGRLGEGRLVLGAPGNPASALVCAELFLRPLLFALQGLDPSRPLTPVRLLAGLAANGPREHYMRAVLSHAPDGALEAMPMPDQDSSLVAVFSRSSALLRRAAHAPALAVGDVAEALPLARL